MISISKLYCCAEEGSDRLRYGTRAAAPHKRPVVVWNCTRRCNLRCRHCYSRSDDSFHPGELTTAEGFSFLEDLAEFRVPVVLFSGGEPMLRPDLAQLVEHAAKLGLRAVISTSGTLLGEKAAARFKEIGVGYVGISLDGLQATHDAFRGVGGAFESALRGVRNCLKLGVKVGLRFTITRSNVADIAGIFDLAEREKIPRICFYHLVYSGRGSELMSEDLDHSAARKTLDLIIDRTIDLHRRKMPIEVLTVDNHADGPYIYLRMLREKSPLAETALKLLKMNGGNSSGIGIGCLGWDGAVHPDPFWRQQVLGNVRDRKFSELWSDSTNPLLSALRNRRERLQGRCARCRFLEICGGNFRARAEAATGNLWAPDPACFLTDAEIGI